MKPIPHFGRYAVFLCVIVTGVFAGLQIVRGDHPEFVPCALAPAALEASRNRTEIFEAMLKRAVESRHKISFKNASLDKIADQLREIRETDPWLHFVLDKTDKDQGIIEGVFHRVHFYILRSNGISEMRWGYPARETEEWVPQYEDWDIVNRLVPHRVIHPEYLQSNTLSDRLRAFRILYPGEADKLAAEVRKRNGAARQAMAESQGRLILRLAGKKARDVVSEDEMDERIVQGYLSALKAAEKYEVGGNFKAYSASYISGWLRRHFDNLSKRAMKEFPLTSIEAPAIRVVNRAPAYELSDPVVQRLIGYLMENTSKISKITKEHWEALLLYYGFVWSKDLGDEENPSLEDIGRLYGKGRTRIKQWCDRIVRLHRRKPQIAEMIAAYLYEADILPKSASDRPGARVEKRRIPVRGTVKMQEQVMGPAESPVHVVSVRIAPATVYMRIAVQAQWHNRTRWYPGDRTLYVDGYPMHTERHWYRYSIGRYVSAIQDARPDETVLLVQSNGNLFKDDGAVAYARGDLYHREGESVARRRYSCLVIDSDGRTAIRELRFAKEGTKWEVFAHEGDRTRDITTNTNYAMSGLQIVKDGAAITPEQLLLRRISDLNLLLSLPVIHMRGDRTEETRTLGYDELEADPGKLIAAVSGETVRINLNAIQGTLIVIGPETLRTYFTGLGYQKVDSPRDIKQRGDFFFPNPDGSMLIRFKEALNSLSVVGVTENGEFLSVILGAAPGDRGVTLREAAMILKNLGAHDAIVIAQGGDVLLKYIRKGQPARARGLKEGTACVLLVSEDATPLVKGSNLGDRVLRAAERAL